MFIQNTSTKIWRFNAKSEDKVIAFIDGTIYKGNPPNDKVEHCLSDLRMGIIPATRFIGIPLHYIKEIRMQESKNYLQIFFGQDSEEHLRIHDEASKNEVFDYFREHIPSAQFTIDRYSKLKAGKKPLIAMAVVVALFLWTLYYAVGFDKGIEYETVNGRYNSVTGIVLAIASFGVFKTILFYSIWFAIALWSFLQKIKKPPVMHRLMLRGKLSK